MTWAYFIATKSSPIWDPHSTSPTLYPQASDKNKSWLAYGPGAESEINVWKKESLENVCLENILIEVTEVPNPIWDSSETPIPYPLSPLPTPPPASDQKHTHYWPGSSGRNEFFRKKGSPRKNLLIEVTEPNYPSPMHHRHNLNLTG